MPRWRCDRCLTANADFTHTNPCPEPGFRRSQAQLQPRNPSRAAA